MDDKIYEVKAIYKDGSKSHIGYVLSEKQAKYAVDRITEKSKQNPNLYGIGTCYSYIEAKPQPLDYLESGYWIAENYDVMLREEKH